MASERQWGDSLNVQLPKNAAERGELEPFIDAGRAKFVGLILANQFRRSNNRMGAVNYGTAHTFATPVMAPGLEDLALYYHHLLERAAKDERSEELYESMAVMQLTVETLTERLLEVGLEEKERTETLIEIDKTLVEMESVAEDLKGLLDA